MWSSKSRLDAPKLPPAPTKEEMDEDLKSATVEDSLLSRFAAKIGLKKAKEGENDDVTKLANSLRTAEKQSLSGKLQDVEKMLLELEKNALLI